MAERIFVALDLETTGLDSSRDAIIEIGAVRFSGDTVLDRFATFVHPQRPIPLRVQQITAITDRDVANSPTIDTIAPELLAFVDGSVHAVVAHNAPFDLGFLQRAGIHFHRPALDTHELSSIVLPGMSSYSLGELCRQLNITLPHAHRALDDAEAAARLFMHIQGVLQRLPRPILRTLIDCAGDNLWDPLLLMRDALALSTVDSVWPGAQLTQSIDEIALPEPVAGHVTAVPPAAVDRAFAADGPLAQLMGDGYEVRRGQVEMAQTVLQALNHGSHHIIEAGTGTGKSMAYLLPAALWSLANGQRVVIATDTITLQEQLIEQEIPRLAAMTGAPVQAALLKGRSHYLCLRRLRAWISGRSLSQLELRLLTRILIWLPHTRTGDLSELSIYDNQERALLQSLCSDSQSCTEERCGSPTSAGSDGLSWLQPPGMAQDFYWTARRRAQSAHLLVINHALLLADLQNKGRVLPEYNHLIVDEAHRLEHAATEQFTFRIESKRLELHLRRLPLKEETLALLADQPQRLRLAQQIAQQTERISTSLRSFVASLIRIVKRHGGEEEQAGQEIRVDLDLLRPQPRWSQVEIEWDSISTALRRLTRMLAELVGQLEAARWWQADVQAQILADFQRSYAYLAEIDQQLELLIMGTANQRRDTISWLELNAEGKVLTFCLAPVHISEVLESGLFRSRRSVILTGATLRTDEGFDFIQERLGFLHAQTRTVESPFDYRSNVLLYLPSDMPAPDRGGYQSAVERAIVETARAADGRTLVLFTSHAHLRATADAVRSPLDQAGVTVLEHGSSGRGQLLREFRSGRKAVLLGTGTFWEGIDLPGEMLSCLIIVRLPFAVPTDPLVKARSQAYDNPFNDYTLPDAVLRFRQGFGRLIRRADDRGLVVLLDSRIWQRPYGSAFVDALPACTVRHAPLMNLSENIGQWLNNRPWSLPNGYDGRPKIFS